MTEYTFCLLFVERIVVTGMSGCGGRESFREGESDGRNSDVIFGF